MSTHHELAPAPPRRRRVALTAGIVLRVYRNGQPVNGDPASMRLGAHNEIVEPIGPTAVTVRSTRLRAG